MKTWISTLMAVAMALLLVTPALAAGDGEDGTVTKTFELTLNGDVPEDRAFAVYYSTDVTNVGGAPTDYILFCGGTESDRAKARQVVTREDCVGGGDVYSGQVEFERGTQLVTFFITAVEESENFEIFHTNVPTRDSPPELLSTDTTNRAWYTFGASDDQQLPGVPATGAGGMSGTPLPAAGHGLVLALLATSGCAALSWRRRSARSTQ